MCFHVFCFTGQKGLVGDMPAGDSDTIVSFLGPLRVVCQPLGQNYHGVRVGRDGMTDLFEAVSHRRSVGTRHDDGDIGVTARGRRPNK